MLSIVLLCGAAALLLLLSLLRGTPSAIGEWDDFSLATISMINDGNVTIDKTDIALAKEWLPEWAEYLDTPRLSGYKTASGDELTWYFPTFSIMCVPVMGLLHLFGLSGVYTVPIMNILLFMLALLYAFFCCGFSSRVRFGLLVALSVNPIIFYTQWISGEIYIFSFLLIALICWQKEQYKRAAVLISIASHLNPTVLVVGIVVIADYLYHMLRSTGIRIIWSRYREIMLFAVCFLPSLFPFAWNLFYAGRINLTAATETDLNLANIFGRFKAYMLDWNLGLFPYYGILFLLFLIAFAVAVWKRNGKVAAMGIAFFGTCVAYSIEIHINSGMSGIARYNAWASAIMIVAFFLWRNGVSDRRKATACDIGAKMSAVWTAGVMLSILLTNPIGYMEMTPLARAVLRYAPQFYTPYFDIFNDRVNHVDEIGYRHNLPIVYRDGYWQCRKILACYENKETILLHADSSEENIAWLSDQLDAMKGNGDGYISISPDKVIYWRD